MLITIICSILLGALAGWIAGKLMHNQGTFVRNVILGIVGSALGGAIANRIGIGGGLIVELLIAVGGACLILWLANLLTKK